ncbi:MAG: ribosome silencing factor [Pseudomonadota bacterium]
MNAEQLKDLVVDALEDRKGIDIKVLDVHDKSSVTDIMVIVGGNSNRQVKALAESVLEKAKASGVVPLGMEGQDESSWVLVDLGDVVVHVMLPETRDFYNLEKLWGEDAPSEQSAGDGTDGD